MSSPGKPNQQFKLKSAPELIQLGPGRKEYLKNLFKAAYAQLEAGSWKDTIGSPDQFRQIVSFYKNDGKTLNLILKGVPKEFSQGVKAAIKYLQADQGGKQEVLKEVKILASLDEAEKEAAKEAERARNEKARREKKIQGQIDRDQEKINYRLSGLGALLGKQKGAIYAALSGDEVLLIIEGKLYRPMGGGGTLARASGKPEPCYLLQNTSGTFQAVSGQVAYADAIGATSTGVDGLAYQEKKTPHRGSYISFDTGQRGGPYQLLQMPAGTQVKFYGTDVVVTETGDLQLSDRRPLRRGRYPDDENLTVDIIKIRDTVTTAGLGLQVDGSTLIHLDDRSQFTQASPHIVSDPDWYASVLAGRLAAGMIDGDIWAAQDKPYFYLRFQPQNLQLRLHVSIRASYSQVVTRLSQTITAGQQWPDALNILFGSSGFHVTGEASYGAQNLGIYPAGATVSGLDDRIYRYVIRDQPTWNTYLRATVSSNAAVVADEDGDSEIWQALETWADNLIAQAQQTISIAALGRMLTLQS